MKKFLYICLSLTLMVLIISGCYSMEDKQLAEEIRRNAKPIAVSYIKDKYGFNPRVIGVQEISTKASEYMEAPTKDVIVRMRHYFKNFDVIVMGEKMDNKCYDNYQDSLYSDKLENYISENLNLSKEDKIKTNIGIKPKKVDNAIHPYYSIGEDIFNIINNPEEPLDFYAVIKTSRDNLKDLSREDLSLIFPENIDAERKILVANFRNEEDFLNMRIDYELYSQIQDNYDPRIIQQYGIYLKDLAILSNNKVEYYEYNLQNVSGLNIVSTNKVLNVSEKYENLPFSPEKYEKFDRYDQLTNKYIIKTENDDIVYVYFDKKEIKKYHRSLYYNIIIFEKKEDGTYEEDVAGTIGKYIVVKLEPHDGISEFFLTLPR